MTKEELIAQNNKRKYVWYIDVKGEDQNGETVWLSGNALAYRQAGYGDFYTYTQVKKTLDNFEMIFNPKEEDLPYCSEDGVTKFTPKEIYLGYSPLNEWDSSDNKIFFERKFRRYNVVRYSRYWWAIYDAIHRLYKRGKRGPGKDPNALALYQTKIEAKLECDRLNEEAR